MVHLPPHLGPGLPAHLHLHVGVRPGGGLEPGLGVEVEPGRAGDGEVYRGGLSDLLLAPDEVVGGADVLSVILNTSRHSGHSSLEPHLEYDIVQQEDPGVAPDDDLVVEPLDPLVDRERVGVCQTGEAHPVPDLTGDRPTGLQGHDVRRVWNTTVSPSCQDTASDNLHSTLRTISLGPLTPSLLCAVQV